MYTVQGLLNGPAKSKAAFDMEQRCAYHQSLPGNG